jgi:hypothetical protein
MIVSQVSYFAAATQAALALAAFRTPCRGRSTSVNAWWGRFGRNADDAEEVMVSCRRYATCSKGSS